MLIYRVEHDRNVCSNSFYSIKGNALVGHGPQRTFYNCGARDRPNFGGCRNPPRRITPDYYCAVTAKQFSQWCGNDNLCRYTDMNCWGSAFCAYCPIIPQPLRIPDNWLVVCYEVEGVYDDLSGPGWHEDNDQIIFNPWIACRVGVIAESNVKKLLARQDVLV